MRRIGAVLALVAVSAVLVFDRARWQYGFIALAQSGLVFYCAATVVGYSKEWGLLPVSLEEVIGKVMAAEHGPECVLRWIMLFTFFFIVSVFATLYLLML